MPKASTETGFWTNGVNSLLHPQNVPSNQYAWAENVMSRGGIPQTRPGFKYLSEIDGTILQGMAIFQPNGSRPRMVIAVDGIIYAAAPPYKAFTALDIKFSQDAPIINFQSCLQSTKLNADGSITLIPPKRILIIQDDRSRAGVWDGSQAKKLDPDVPSLQTPTGLWMVWAAQRLWVARGSKLFASDLTNPTSFSEETYLAERSSFELPDDITGMIETPDRQGLLVFTRDTTTVFQSGILDRTKWQQTNDFQSLLLPNVGCVAGKSTVNRNGVAYWFSESGLTRLDAALASLHTSKLTTLDGEMTRSKRKLSPELSGICSNVFENLLLVSVPSGDAHNAHTWVHDEAPLGQAGNGVDSQWMGIWSGIRPTQWANTTIVGRKRCFCATTDNTSKNGTRIHIWEAFDPARMDNEEGRIQCQFETGIIKTPLKRKFCYAELDVLEVLGRVNLKVFFGGIKGAWIQVLDTVLTAEEGSIGSVDRPLIEKGELIESYKKQCRTVRTQEFSIQGKECSAESGDAAGIDKGFAILVQWRGQMGIAGIRLCTDEFADSDQGNCSKSESDEENIVLEDGATVLT